MRKPNSSDDQASKLKLYAIIVFGLVVIGLAIIFFPKGTPLQQCLSIFLVQNKDSCLLSLAYSTSNQSVCAYIADSNAQGCYSSIAILKQSAQICQKAGNNQSIALCVVQIANLTSNINACASLIQPYKDGCSFAVAIKQKSTSVCNSIANASLATSCSSIINIKYASMTLRQGYCANVSSTTNRSVLLSVINSVKGLFSTQNQSTIITLASNPFLQAQNYTPRDLCYILISSKTQNLSICSKTSAFAQGICKYSSGAVSNSTFSNYTQLLQNCNLLTQYQAQCVQYVQLSKAISTKNASICMSLPTTLAYSCYSALASTYSNSTYCAYISNSTANNACLLQLKYH